jgi:hypothetical protein
MTEIVTQASGTFEICSHFGKPCGPSLNSRGPVKVYHMACALEMTREARESVARKNKVAQGA